MSEGTSNEKPKARMTAYAFYLQSCWANHKENSPNETADFAEFSKECAARWKTIPCDEKKKFLDMAEEDITRYNKDMENYRHPRFSRDRLRQRPYWPDPKVPKRPMSAFFWYCQDERSKILEENPELSIVDISRELGQRWLKLDPEIKAKYEALGKNDQMRYDREVAAYKKPVTTTGTMQKM